MKQNAELEILQEDISPYLLLIVISISLTRVLLFPNSYSTFPQLSEEATLISSILVAGNLENYLHSQQ